METLKVLELFAGSRSIGKAADVLGYKVFSVDWQKFDGIDLSIDIGDLKISDVPFIPDIIWASPDCTTYSIAAISTHRNKDDRSGKTEYAQKCDIVNQHWLNLIEKWIEINPDLVYYIENPRGGLEKCRGCKIYQLDILSGIVNMAMIEQNLLIFGLTINFGNLNLSVITLEMA